MAYFGGNESGLPDFGRPWTPNRCHQVNFSATPEKFGVWRFKWAMLKVGGIKIERTPLRYFIRPDTEIDEKVIFLVILFVAEIFQQETFSGLVPTEPLRTENSEKVFGLGFGGSVSKL